MINSAARLKTGSWYLTHVHDIYHMFMYLDVGRVADEYHRVAPHTQTLNSELWTLKWCICGTNSVLCWWSRLNHLLRIKYWHCEQAILWADLNLNSYLYVSPSQTEKHHIIWRHELMSLLLLNIVLKFRIQKSLQIQIYMDATLVAFYI